MNHHINNKYVATGISSYNDSFWKAMRGSDKAYGDLIDGKHSLTNTYLLPESTATKYSASLKEYDLFRRIGTVMSATKSDSTIWLSDTDEFPAWVSEHGTIPTTVESFPKKDDYHRHRDRFHQRPRFRSGKISRGPVRQAFRQG